MPYTVLNQHIANTHAERQFRRNTRTIDVGGIYAEIVLNVEKEAWGGQRGISITVFPRPSRPVSIRAFTTDWPPPVDTYSPSSEAGNMHASYVAALDRLSDDTADWITRYVLALAEQDR